MFRIDHSPLAVALLLALVGCGEGSRTYPATGTVTFQGKPVPRGSVGFIADYSQGNKAPWAYAPIVDGNFATPPGKGHGGGAYAIRVVGLDGVPVQTGEGDLDQNGSPMFPTYEKSVQLQAAAEVINIEVPAVP